MRGEESPAGVPELGQVAPTAPGSLGRPSPFSALSPPAPTVTAIAPSLSGSANEVKLHEQEPRGPRRSQSRLTWLLGCTFLHTTLQQHLPRRWRLQFVSGVLGLSERLCFTKARVLACCTYVTASNLKARWASEMHCKIHSLNTVSVGEEKEPNFRRT